MVAHAQTCSNIGKISRLSDGLSSAEKQKLKVKEKRKNWGRWEDLFVFCFYSIEKKKKKKKHTILSQSEMSPKVLIDGSYCFFAYR